MYPTQVVNMTEFSDWLKQERKNRGYTVRQLSELADITHTRISDLESGENPRRDTAERIAKALAPNTYDEESLNRYIDQALMKAGYMPEHGTYKIIPNTSDYEILVDEIRAAASDDKFTDADKAEILAFIKFRRDQKRAN